MERVPVSSSLVVSAGYDPESSTLEVELSNGSVYRYFQVEESVYTDLLQADSPGKYFNDAVVNGGYEYERTT